MFCAFQVRGSVVPAVASEGENTRFFLVSFCSQRETSGTFMYRPAIAGGRYWAVLVRWCFHAAQQFSPN